MGRLCCWLGKALRYCQFVGGATKACLGKIIIPLTNITAKSDEALALLRRDMASIAAYERSRRRLSASRHRSSNVVLNPRGRTRIIA